ncbi:hypothetical protein NADFUDRAFT_53778 [Nadsonia fulvescens var. elongata DSM 6958]|uniref:Uncharacterized protein n=1 Tax=Nadsonia fulvescens var. elongata DSM 6958 TaxID=857566 RepID=A0A1E3PCH1_9ASCO|nr:hypothetical protein NADFUDRAFT_53778 [Nadsonia fulvescens var. elongata DSM 6958]
MSKLGSSYFRTRATSSFFRDGNSGSSDRSSESPTGLSATDIAGNLFTANLSKSPPSSGINASNATWKPDSSYSRQGSSQSEVIAEDECSDNNHNDQASGIKPIHSNKETVKSENKLDNDSKAKEESDSCDWGWSQSATDREKLTSSLVENKILNPLPLTTSTINYSILKETNLNSAADIPNGVFPSTNYNEALISLDRQAANTVKSIQRLLDAQSRLLLSTNLGSAGKAHIRGIRRQLTLAMAQLSQLATAKGHILTKLSSAQRYIFTRLQSCSNRKIQIFEELNRVRKDAEKDTKLLKVKETQVNTDHEIAATEAEIERLTQRLVQLKNKKAMVDNNLDRSMSIIESRTSRFVSMIATTTEAESRYVQLAQAQQVLPNFSDTLQAKDAAKTKEALAIHLKAIENMQSTVTHETEALCDGTVVWRAVCDTVQEAERTIKQAVFVNKEQQDGTINIILKILTDSEKVLRERYDLTVKKNWSLLMVAVGHELEAIRQGISILQASERSSA